MEFLSYVMPLTALMAASNLIKLKLNLSVKIFMLF